MTCSLGLLSYVISMGANNICAWVKDKNQFPSDEDLYITFFLFSVSLLPIKILFVFFVYIIIIICKKMDISLKKYLCLFAFFCAMYFFGNYTLDETIKFLLPCLIFFLIPKKFYYSFLVILTLFSYIFDNSFYLSSSYYIGVLAFLVSLIINDNMIRKMERFILTNEEKKKIEYNNYTLQLVNVLNSFDELIDLLQKDEFDKKEQLDEDYYMKKEHKRLFNKEISFFKEPLHKMMKLMDSPEDIYINKYNVKCYSMSKAYQEGENGDYNIFIEEKNIFNSLLVDGMGHNKISKKIAKYVSSLYLHMKHLSSSDKEIITCLNAFIKGKTYDEIYSTFDLLKIDLVNGNFYSYQYGSYPTYLIRDKTTTKISQIFPPVGIISILEVEPYIGQIKPNDIFVQISDGFKENLDKEIERFFRFYSGQDDDMIIDYLFDYLSSHATLEDDKTLIVLKILRNDEKISHL
ncbi:MAG: SpoIIE family protein phosphatase [Bacilli bacterium]